ncbi:hypothetical protein PF005_g28316 [Phytophthora fragariae]|uniref:Uncharacterized protein n=1 Tax=Phytophthora fragariae TaxID=53985 RepID=A0A6A4BBJ5_9STRA|nr:hypothetical protein PF003_g15544 [Phytophthora fragariae]KAE8920842.1 hypothetical protein PF009_g28869 [Phytophthora fragariae]KAE8989870.1 hypothetical protein PF011_g18586 [Phytophthora fragariae]KAE9064144.1 hypothetical protein PF010_g28727 [Phytophthora fragariae]KAE9074519.1 hypothetical protein PF007_g25375 [Phytophthora fragariae]
MPRTSMVALASCLAELNLFVIEASDAVTWCNNAWKALGADTIKV